MRLQLLSIPVVLLFLSLVIQSAVGEIITADKASMRLHEILDAKVDNTFQNIMKEIKAHIYIGHNNFIHHQFSRNCYENDLIVLDSDHRKTIGEKLIPKLTEYGYVVEYYPSWKYVSSYTGWSNDLRGTCKNGFTGYYYDYYALHIQW
jgi:hypothetical protein